MRDALATLPWVETGTIDADRATRTVRFGINDQSQFSLDKVSEAHVTLSLERYLHHADVNIHAQ